MTTLETDASWKYLRPSKESKAKEVARPFDSKKNCWILDADEAFVAATIKFTKVGLGLDSGVWG